MLCAVHSTHDGCIFENDLPAALHEPLSCIVQHAPNHARLHINIRVDVDVRIVVRVHDAIDVNVHINIHVHINDCQEVDIHVDVHIDIHIHVDIRVDHLELLRNRLTDLGCFVLHGIANGLKKLACTRLEHVQY